MTFFKILCNFKMKQEEKPYLLMTQIARLKKKNLLLFFNWNHLLFLVFPERKEEI